jgi:CBS domain-containing protein
MKMMNEPLSAIMTQNVITLSENDLLSDAKKILLEHDIRHIPIVDNDRTLVGILSVYDLMKIDDHHKTKILTVMTKGIAKLLPDDKIGSAAQIFGKHLFHSLPIVDQNNKVIGKVTPYDVLNYIFKKTYPTSF